MERVSQLFGVAAESVRGGLQLIVNRGVLVDYVLVLLFIIISSMALAQPDSRLESQLVEIEKTAELCFEGSTSLDQTKSCGLEKLKEVEQILAQIYTDRVTSLNERIELEKSSDDLAKTGEETLRRYEVAQAAWIAFRDADCDRQGSEMINESSESLIVVGCLAHKTIKRINELTPMSFN